MNIVSGIPRSGTSLATSILLDAIGPDRFIGKRFPMESKQREKTDLEHAKKMNPEGFFEFFGTVQGLSYNLRHHQKIAEIRNATKIGRPLFGKIVSQGLQHTDPELIDKVIYMARDPAKVATSQQDLTSNVRVKNAGNIFDLRRAIGPVRQTHSWLTGTAIAARWFLANPDVPVLIVDYDVLIANPKEEVARWQSFLGEGDFSNSHELVKPNLNRSKPLKKDSDDQAISEARTIHRSVLSGDWQNALNLLATATQENRKAIERWQCLRLEKNVHEGICQACIESATVRKNFAKRAEEKGINWRSAPCVYLATKPEGIRPTLKETIRDNHWIPEQDNTHDESKARKEPQR